MEPNGQCHHCVGRNGRVRVGSDGDISLGLLEQGSSGGRDNYGDRQIDLLDVSSLFVGAHEKLFGYRYT